MAKKNQPQTGTEQKVQTRYDRKMEARRKQEEKDKREAKMLRIGAVTVCVLLVLAVAGSIGASVWSRKAATKDAYVTIGEHKVTKLEFDYYYNAMLNSYSSLMAYMGMDATSDLASQPYSEDLTWKDFFDEMAVEQLKQAKAMADDAAANNFSHDVTEEYANMVNSLKSVAESMGMSVEEYYKMTYGEYATEKNMEPYLKEGLLTEAYRQHLMEQNAPEAQEIKDYYAENVQSYDKVDYRSFVFNADIAEGAVQEDIDKAMTEAEKKAEAMLEARKGGADFRQLCIENASGEEKAAYEDTETDASLREGAKYAGTPSAISDWLYEDGRTQGDMEVVEDIDGNRYYVVEFIKRYYDEADDKNISDTIANERVAEYVSQLAGNYTVTDNKGELKYLTVNTGADAAEGGTDAEAAEPGTDAGTGEEPAADTGSAEETGTDS